MFTRVISAAAVAAAIGLLAACNATPDRADRHDDANAAPAPALAAVPSQAAATSTALDRDAAVAATEPLAGAGATVLVSGLSCPKCATNAELALREVPGVLSADLDLSTGEIALVFGKQKPAPAQIAKAVERAGFTFRGLRAH